MVALPTLIPLSEAARKYGLDEARLHELVEKGKIRAGRLPGLDEVFVSEDEVRGAAIQEKGLRKEDLPEYQKHADKRGKPIWISKASRDYQIPHPTILKWVRAGIIRTLGREANRLLIDEADVAYCAEIYRKRGKPGRILFNPDGTPYRPKTDSLAV